ncbi:MAG: YbaN family protein [Bacteroides sp.]|nr:YbaN family protein [Bacteroides sp.]
MKILYILLGSLCLALGIIGIFLPLLPTTPFLLLSATLYFRGSPRLYNWLLAHKQLGPYIRNFREHKAIPLRAKIISVSLVWITLLYCACFITRHLWLSFLFVCLAAGISYHILSFKTLKREEKA